MNVRSIERSKNISIVVVSNQAEAFKLMDSGFWQSHPHVRLFFLEEEEEWLPVARIWESLKRKRYLNVGRAADYI